MSTHSEDSDSSDESYIPPNDGDASEDEELTNNEQDIKEGSKISNSDVDKIWDAFKSDLKSDKQSKIGANGDQKNSKPEESTPTEKSGAKKDTITVTKVYEFAGEEVKVSKEVSKDSEEAQSHLKATNIPAKQRPLPPLGRGKRTGGLMGVLGKLNKKPKLSTLEKSKLDWQNYKDEEGIQEELKTHNKGKDGYLGKKFFLERTDFRQFEKEREVRLSRSSKR